MKRATQRRILLMTPFPPDPGGTHGGARMTGELVRRLAGRHEVALLYLRGPADPGVPPALTRLLAVIEEVKRPDRQSTALRRAGALSRALPGILAGRPAWVSDWRVPAFADRVRAVAERWRPEIVQAEFHVMGQYLGEGPEGAARVLVEHEPGAIAAMDRARGPSGVGHRVDAVAWRRYERRVLRAADAVVAFTEADRAELRTLAPEARIECVPPGIELPDTPLDAGGTAPPRVLFAGNYAHPPNVSAALELAREIHPRVRERVPDAVLELIGPDPPRSLRRLSAPDVVVAGAVPDLEPHLDRAAVVAVPLRTGGGVRVKVLEALAAGKAVVGTSKAMVGTGVEPGRQALIAEAPDELALAIADLLRDASLRQGLGAAARELAIQRLGWEQTLDRYDELYSSL